MIFGEWGGLCSPWGIYKSQVGLNSRLVQIVPVPIVKLRPRHAGESAMTLLLITLNIFLMNHCTVTLPYRKSFKTPKY